MSSLFRVSGLAAIALIATNAHAQFNEVEPNSLKTEANTVAGIVNGGTITGTSTGTGATAGDTSLTTYDVYRVSTGALPLGVYKHTLTLNNAVNTASILGVGQTAGVPNTTTNSFQASTGSVNAWYGFGKQEELYYRVGGTAASTTPYVATLATTAVTPTAIAGTFNAGNITITTAGQGHSTDTELYLYDSNLNPVPLGHNDDLLNGIAGPSTVSIVLAAGTYYVAVSNYNTANNVGDLSPTEGFQTGPLLDFPNVMANTTTTLNVNVGYSVSDGTTTTPVAATRAGAFEIVWGTFNVTGTIPPPANDNCASAAATAASNATYIATATNDGGATCDSGGGASRDVWYTYTDTLGFGGTLSLNTCGSTAIDTVLSVYSSCGGAELACNDDCAGTPCAGPTSCTSVVLAPGQSVLIRVSDKGLGGTYVTLNSSFVGNPPTNDLCANAIVLAGPGSYGFDTTLATSGEGISGTCGTPPNKNLWYSYAATTNGSLTVSTCGLVTGGNSQDTEIAVYQGPGCPTVAPLACNDDAGSACSASTLNSIVTIPTTCGSIYIIEVGNFSATTTINISGQFSVTETGTACSTPVTYYCPGDGTGTTACPCANSGATGNGCANSINANGGNLAASGNASLAGDTWLLSATGIPNGPGLYFQGTVQLNAGNGVVFGDGLRCVGGTIIRLGIVTGVANASSYPSPNPPAVNAIPISLKGLIAAGDVRNYQLWYRDSGAFCTAAVFNLTNAVNVTWTP